MLWGVALYLVTCKKKEDREDREQREKWEKRFAGERAS